ncbi:hypothetical protein ACFIQF_12975 [Comamonas sp. J-3]|uniref:hypothetical protein n=1 Tax=Comamonas trifloxystrobinivorans TaxID=3350256 RepID=UPI00372CC141
MHIGVGGGSSVVDGQTVREPTQVFDTVTQQYLGGQQQAQAKPQQFVKGQVYVDPQSGKHRTWNGTGWSAA